MNSPNDRPSDEELRLFLERIARRLAEQPVGLDAPAHREKVAALLRKSGEASFYQMLGLQPTASALEVHEAYERTARLVHPSHARLLDLEGRQAVLEVLFERVTQAYLTLSQPDRRKRYDSELGPEAWAAAITPAGSQRQEEARDVARRYFERAVELTVTDDYYFAVELVQQAVRLDPRPEYHALLGRLQAKNHRWLRSASENLQTALDLGSKDAELPVILDRVREQLASGLAAAPERRKGLEDPEVQVLDPEEIDVPLPGGKSKRRKK
ncbi:MAG TPA: DnaJ domain-containing protein [Thermoanaerobaculia bacterium]|nr:DnaJ domain-containing protein [Thermoanaerobaculia bacterium]